MKSSISELLNKEHEVILNAGRIIPQLNNQWLTDPDKYTQTVNQLLEFFTIYSDQFHHHKEEEILFPAISKKNEVAGAAIVSELNEHHEEFRALTKKIRTALENNEYSNAQQLLENYVNQLKDHIAVEDDELFPMADDLFSPDELDKLYYNCVDKDEELGRELKLKLENLIKNFETNATVQ